MVLQSELVENIARTGGQLAAFMPGNAENQLSDNDLQHDIRIVSSDFATNKYTHAQASEARRYFCEPMRDNAALWSRHLHNCHSPKLWIRLRAKALHALHRAPFRTHLADRAVSHVDRWLHRSPKIRSLLQRLNPDVVVSTYPVSSFETACLLEAQALRIPTVGHLLSWDNITCKGRFAALPDYFISWGPVMSGELGEAYGVSPDRIFECGVPHFDEHVRLVDPVYRATVLRRMGLDPDRPYLLIGMSAPIFAPHEIDIVEWLANQVERDRFGPEMQLVIRPHPQNVVGNMADPTWLPRLERLVSSRVALNKPLLTGGGLPWAMELEDLKVLVNLLSGCSICLNSGSTLSIDAVIHDKPVIVTLFDADRELPWWKSARRVRDFPHYRKLLAMGGVQAVDSFATLSEEVDAYLRKPMRHGDRRAFTVTRECGSVDGNASSRAANALLRILAITKSGHGSRRTDL
jgi:hypothetical protein